MPTALPLDSLGARENAGTVSFALWLPWVSSADGFRVAVRVIHERDQYLQGVAASEFAMAHEQRAPYGDYWSVSVPIAGPSPLGSHWGSSGRYLYRYCVYKPDGTALDWIVDPYAREFGVGKQSAVTLAAQPYVWSNAEAGWRTPALNDLIVYEIDIAEFGGDLERTENLLAYLADLGVNAIELMPLSNVASSVDWGYLPIGYFGVDERFGSSTDLQALIDRAHQCGIAVLVDMVYGHTGVDFGYYDVYTRLGFNENPFMGPFAKDYFGAVAKSTDYQRPLTRDYFFTVNQYWLDVFHVDGIRYDCVPNFWDGAMGVGYSNLVYATYELVKQRVSARAQYWQRFDAGPAAPLRLVQCAEQLEAPVEILSNTYSNATWQNGTFSAAKAVAQGNRGSLTDFGVQLGLAGYPELVTTNGEALPRTALQYLENHDHERFICNFGTYNTDDAQNPLFQQGDRSRWFKVQPYLIALLAAKGVPLLWAGQEFCENFWVPDVGSARVGMLRPVSWDDFYDRAGRGVISLVRRLLRLRRSSPHLRAGAHFFFNDWDRYQQLGVLLFARYDAKAYSLIAINTTDADVQVPFWFPIAGDYAEELEGGALGLTGVRAFTQTELVVPSNYGRIWTHRSG